MAMDHPCVTHAPTFNIGCEPCRQAQAAVDITLPTAVAAASAWAAHQAAIVATEAAQALAGATGTLLPILSGLGL